MTFEFIATRDYAFHIIIVVLACAIGLLISFGSAILLRKALKDKSTNAQKILTPILGVASSIAVCVPFVDFPQIKMSISMLRKRE